MVLVPWFPGSHGPRSCLFSRVADNKSHANTVLVRNVQFCLLPTHCSVIGLTGHLLTALAAALGAVFVVVSVVMMSPWAGALITFVIGCLVGQLFGALGVLGIKLSAVPAVIIILSIGLGVEFTIHILVVSNN